MYLGERALLRRGWLTTFNARTSGRRQRRRETIAPNILRCCNVMLVIVEDTHSHGTCEIIYLFAQKDLADKGRACMRATISQSDTKCASILTYLHQGSFRFSFSVYLVLTLSHQRPKWQCEMGSDRRRPRLASEYGKGCEITAYRAAADSNDKTS